jgi:hypothetical protein
MNDDTIPPSLPVSEVIRALIYHYHQDGNVAVTVLEVRAGHHGRPELHVVSERPAEPALV